MSLLCEAAWAAAPALPPINNKPTIVLLPLEAVLLPLPRADLEKLKGIARRQAKSRPVYHSTPTVGTLPQIVRFEGVYTPTVDNPRLVIFSDDGCDVWIDDVRVWQGFEKLQHLPTLGQSFHELETSLSVGKPVRIRVDYANRIYRPEIGDIDGVTLFVGAAAPRAMIDGDINRDGKVDDADKDAMPASPQGKKQTVGLIVMRDHDDNYDPEAKEGEKGKETKKNVYFGIEEWARRREIKISNADGKDVELRRSSDKLRIFDKEKFGEGKEVSFTNNKATVKPGTYWLQGGSTASDKVRSDWLEVRREAASKDPDDKLAVTVLWVEISGRNKGKVSQSPLYSNRDRFIKQVGWEDLGSHFAKDGSELENYAYSGVEITGVIFPANLSADSFDKKITQDFLQRNGKEFLPQKTDFGFIFRRLSILRAGRNGEVRATRTAPDDSFFAFQDVTPDLDDMMRMAIIDADTPAGTINIQNNEKAFFLHVRNNFLEHVVFSINSNTRERCSTKFSWARTLDIGADDSDKIAYVRGEPSEEKEINTSIIGKHLTEDGFKINFPNPSLSGTKLVAGQLKIGKIGIIQCKGKNLVGEAYLLQVDSKDNVIPTQRINCSHFQIKVTKTVPRPNSNDVDYTYSDATEAKVTFTFGDKVKPGKYVLVVRNGGIPQLSKERFNVEE